MQVITFLDTSTNMLGAYQVDTLSVENRHQFEFAMGIHWYEG